MPTRAQYINYALSFVGYYGAGAGHAENDTPFNLKYYGHHVSGSNWSWCRVFEWFVDEHFGMAAENGGKSAYVPANVRGRNAKIWHRPKHGSAAYEPGNKVNYDFNRSGEAEHTGFYWKPRNSATFWAVEGNTGNDQVAKRIRYFADVLDVIETVGFTSTTTGGTTTPPSKDDDVPVYVSLTTKKSVTVAPDQGFYVTFDKEVSDQTHRHNDGGGLDIFSAGKNGSVYTAGVEVTGPVTWQLREVQKESVHDHTNDNGPNLIDAGSVLRLWITPHAAGELSVQVRCAIWDR